MTLYMVFDVESIGLHGEGFAAGYVVIDENGNEKQSGFCACDPKYATGRGVNHDWIRKNIPEMHYATGDVVYLRRWFWHAWRQWQNMGATLWADCAWPVEARFLAQCVDDQVNERWVVGPYPLHEIATLALATGHDPLATNERLPHELPAHDPLNDARQSARLLLQYLGELQSARV